MNTIRDLLLRRPGARGANVLIARAVSQVANNGPPAGNAVIGTGGSSSSARKESISTFLNAFRFDERVLVTGALGQVGQELVPALQDQHGLENVIPTDVRQPQGVHLVDEQIKFHQLDVLDPDQLMDMCQEYEINTIVHLAAILSARGEKNPQAALKINNEGIQNVLEVARRCNNDMKIFCPSTIAVFGPDSPKDHTPEDCILRPSTMYGITKLHAELLGEYYHKTYGVDYRSLRYPGVISTKGAPGGGTTDYAVDIFHQATTRGQYTCYLEKSTTLPFIYMPDLLAGTLQLLQADPSTLSRRVYNLGSMSFAPKQLAASIRRLLPDFSIKYVTDFRQDIADTWPRSIDCSKATKDWNWEPTYDLNDMTRDVLEQLLQKQNENVENNEADEVDLEIVIQRPHFGGGGSSLSPMI
jgi:threonine 3-dehydrogenase